MGKHDPIAAMLGGVVQRGELAGVATLIWRNGEVVQSAAVGWRDKAAAVAMTRDTIFRIASMSKPITSVAAMSLCEDGGFALDQPIADVAPEFTDMRVLRDADGPLHQSDPALRPITFEDLLTHRAGLTYGGIHTGPICAAYYDALGGDIDSEREPAHWMARLAGLPLVRQPGAVFHYGHSTDLLGQLIARIEGVSLGEVLARRVFRPLGMTDTGFMVPAENHHRRARMYGFDRAGQMVVRPAPPGTMAERPADMTYESGGQGLWSTLDDYLAFARLFLGDGAVDGVRVLKPETLAMMTANRLTEEQRTGARMLGMGTFDGGHGFGLGLAVVIDPTRAGPLRGKGGLGTVNWPGAYGGWWQADPTDGSVMLFLVHNLIEPPQIAKGIGFGAYMTMGEFHALGAEMKA
jgi:CubicO group peptidase (beta-lactamase class C family)